MTGNKKSLGQHWLNDSNILDEIVGTADLSLNDHVLEIGPGHGSLTRKLLASGAKLTAVEKDERLASQLAINITNPKLDLQSGDILEFNLSNLPPDYKVVANIPYYLTSNLIRLLSESVNPPASVTLLVQKEVAERLCAQPGKLSILGVSAQHYFQCSLGIIVSADKFTPPPKVDSQVVHMVRKPEKTIPSIDTKQFFRVVKAGFSSRRKTLLNSLSGGLNLPKESINSILVSCDINPSARPQELSLEQWKDVSEKLFNK